MDWIYHQILLLITCIISHSFIRYELDKKLLKKVLLHTFSTLQNCSQLLKIIPLQKSKKNKSELYILCEETF